MVDLPDVASAIATVLSEPGHLGAIYELAGPAALSHKQIAATLQSILQRPVRVEEITADEWSEDARRNGLDDYMIDTLHAMFTYYDQHGFQGNSNVLAYLLGREPNSIDAFVSREMTD
jgi:uncharacterized protein YbjT (DUF2867 family)